MVVCSVAVLVKDIRKVVRVRNKSRSHEAMDFECMTLNTDSTITLSVERCHRAEDAEELGIVHIVTAPMETTIHAQRARGIDYTTIGNVIYVPSDFVESRQSTSHILSIRKGLCYTFPSEGPCRCPPPENEVMVLHTFFR